MVCQIQNYLEQAMSWRLRLASLALLFSVSLSLVEALIKGGQTHGGQVKSLRHNYPENLPINFKSHHKTGWALSTYTCGCFPNYMATSSAEDYLWKGNLPSKGARVVHFMRDYYEVATSAYLYHKNSGERWSTNVGSAAKVLQGLKVAFNGSRSETYTAYLNRVPLEQGVESELHRLLVGTHEEGGFDGGLIEMDQAVQNCTANPSRCVTVCMEGFGSNYMAEWQKATDFLGITMDDKLKACLDAQNIHSPNYHPETMDPMNHITRNDLSKADRDAIVALFHTIDWQKFNGVMQEMSARNPCTKKAR
eukprot:TRINITY_DN1981_c0_g1_i1.p1 TRINITY_DN1981_c0_g1~~TRINITY_DN1981_c0_g1_i1.p1  ORF type:complete len:307 (-),score=45.92 TRINITY_DN1981_c0_g1_i1:291-1211(-)